MSAATMTTSFEGFLHREFAGAVSLPQPERCDGCGRHDQRCWRLGDGNRMVMCEACMRTIWGEELGERLAVRLLLGGAIRTALEGDVPLEFVRGVVDDALAEHLEREARAEALRPRAGGA